MRRYMIAGNWKMNLDRAEGARLVRAISTQAERLAAVDLVVCPASVYLDSVTSAIGDARVAVGAQNMYHQPKGAFTGELSAAMLLDVGCKYVILGHSERRHILGETDAEVRQKAVAALAAGLLPIICVGETLDEREAGRTAEVIRQQFDGSAGGFSDEEMARSIIAYEPVWAIGTGKVATPEQAEEVHVDLRKLLEERYNAGVAEQVRILYGGSVKPANAGELLGQENIDGALVGGASLKADDFLKIAEAVL